jgi:hypothetical protein
MLAVRELQMIPVCLPVILMRTALTETGQCATLGKRFSLMFQLS